MNIVDVIVLDKRSKSIKGRVFNITNKILNLLNVKNSYLEIAIVSQEKIKNINHKYRQHNSSTNVLSFTFDKKILIKNKKHMLGEIFLSNGFIKKHNQSIDYIIIHGILHLLDFDHINSRDRMIMESKEDELLSLIQK